MVEEVVQSPPDIAGALSFRKSGSRPSRARALNRGVVKVARNSVSCNRYGRNLLPPLRIWRNEIFKHFDHRYTNGFLESKNKRIKVIKRVAYHFQKDRRAANSKQRILLRKRRELYAKAA